MIPRIAQFPSELAARAQLARLGGTRVPAVLVHPNWERPAPTVIWMHGRTANKELDPGRYLRWMRAGIAAVSLDLPGHGERSDEILQSPDRSMQVLAQMRAEINGVVAALAQPEYQGIFDPSRLAIGGMSLGGMAALRRLCDPHPFVAAAVECTCGWLKRLYFPPPDQAHLPRWRGPHDSEEVRKNDPSEHLGLWRPIPLLVLHNRGDEIVPLLSQLHFVELLKDHYVLRGADVGLIRTEIFERTGAVQEHSGFGRLSNEAKNLQTEFLRGVLKPE